MNNNFLDGKWHSVSLDESGIVLVDGKITNEFAYFIDGKGFGIKSKMENKNQ